jgi:hypothetical protein
MKKPGTILFIAQLFLSLLEFFIVAAKKLKLSMEIVEIVVKRCYNIAMSQFYDVVLLQS